KSDFNGQDAMNRVSTIALFYSDFMRLILNFILWVMDRV
ncbi:MAG: hypothetical protein RLZZ628_2814, partial [Bacteroidota bacterium]